MALGIVPALAGTDTVSYTIATSREAAVVDFREVGHWRGFLRGIQLDLISGLV